MNVQLRKTSIGLIAFISAVVTFYGFTTVLSGGWYERALAALVSVGVFIALNLFWDYAFSIIPDLRLREKRIGAWANLLAGVMCILAMSTFWNVVGLAGPEVNRLHQNALTTRAEAVWQDAAQAATEFVSLTPQIASLAAKTQSDWQGEESSGRISGSPGKGAVSNTLNQIYENAAAIEQSVKQAAQKVDAIKARGQACLSALQSASSSTQGAGKKEAAIREQIACINEQIGTLNNQNVATLIARSLQNLTVGIVVPTGVANGQRQDLFASILRSSQESADKIASAALQAEPANAGRIDIKTPNVMEGVLIHWRSLIPPIATAAALDLIPLVILVFMVLLYRDAEALEEPRHPWTVKELQDALAQIEALKLDVRADEMIDITPHNGEQSGGVIK